MYRAPTWRAFRTGGGRRDNRPAAHWLRNIDGLCREEGTMYRAPTLDRSSFVGWR